MVIASCCALDSSTKALASSATTSLYCLPSSTQQTVDPVLPTTPGASTQRSLPLQQTGPDSRRRPAGGSAWHQPGVHSGWRGFDIERRRTDDRWQQVPLRVERRRHRRPSETSQEMSEHSPNESDRLIA